MSRTEEEGRDNHQVKDEQVSKRQKAGDSNEEYRAKEAPAQNTSGRASGLRIGIRD